MLNFFVRFSSCYAALKNVAPLHRTQRRGKFNFRGTFRQNSLVIRECVCACGVGMVTKLRPNLLAHKRGEAAKSSNLPALPHQTCSRSEPSLKLLKPSWTRSTSSDGTTMESVFLHWPKIYYNRWDYRFKC